MVDQTLREGAIFHEKYQVIRNIAHGGMGAVYEVIHLETQRRRALKVMLPTVVNSEELRNRFRAEARVAAGIESEHIVETFDAGVDRATGMPFLVMELLKGQELAEAIKKNGRFSPDRALPLLAQVARTLDKTHASRVVHRDLKPENLFLTTREDGSLRAKILDFGIAKIVAEGSGADKTRSLGTPLYMAPEQFDGSAPIMPQTDLFALAHITYTVLTGVPYWSDEMERSPSVYGFLMAIQNTQPEPASHRAARRGASLPPAFDAWFARATARRAQDRFGSAGEQHAALEQAFASAGASFAQSGPQGHAGATVAASPMTYAAPVHQSQPHPPHPYGVQSGPGQTHLAPAYAQTSRPSYGGYGTPAGQAGPIPAPPGGAVKRSGGGGAIWAIVAVLVLAIGGIAVFAFTLRDSPKKKKKHDTTTETSARADTPTTDDNLDEIQFIKKDPAVGSKYTMREKTLFKIAITQPQTADSSESEQKQVTTTILAADGKTVLKIKLQYGDVIKTSTSNGQSQNLKSPVSGKTYIAEYKDGDIVVTDENYRPVAPEEEAEVEKAASGLGKPNPELLALPDVPLKRGDRADTLAEALRGEVAANPDDKTQFSDIHVTLKDIQIKDGVKVGIFDLSFSMTSTPPSEEVTVTVTATVTGTMTIRANDGRTTQVSISGPMTLSGGPVAGKGSMSFETNYE
ncbi:MAG: protein kinase [Polyangiaceae bacterium]|nr:protein kinase [Polyangiaceae bacterium]